MDTFPIIELSGDARQRGLMHGRLLEERIHKTIEFYKKVFKLDEEVILDTANHYRPVIASLQPQYITEMDAIAEAAHVDPRWILALNCRSEIITMVNQDISECTAFVDPNHGYLAQNWDWAEELENLAIIMRITHESGHQVLMMTEPGILGKIGLNSAGIGVTLNFLHAPGKLDGLPIHILLRLLLDTSDYHTAVALTRKHALGKGGNIIVASPSEYVNFEFANTEFYEFSSSTKCFSHTNHYLGNETLNQQRENLASSFARYKRSHELLQFPIESADQLIQFLGDRSNRELPICRPYSFDAEIGNVGTVCSLIMDLTTGTLHYTPGNPFDHDYHKIQIS